jgi:hypothetical protein
MFAVNQKFLLKLNSLFLLNYIVLILCTITVFNFIKRIFQIIKKKNKN